MQTTEARNVEAGSHGATSGITQPITSKRAALDDTAPPGRDELTTHAALKLIGRANRFTEELAGLPRRLANTGQGRPTWTYRHADIVRVAKIYRAAGISLRAAVRVRLAELAGKL